MVLFVMDGCKVYWFEVIWGVEINMDDIEGEVVVILDVCLFVGVILGVLGEFIGIILQVLLKFFVIKVVGECVYDLVCDGEVVELVV